MQIILDINITETIVKSKGYYMVLGPSNHRSPWTTEELNSAFLGYIFSFVVCQLTLQWRLFSYSALSILKEKTDWCNTKKPRMHLLHFKRKRLWTAKFWINHLIETTMLPKMNFDGTDQQNNPIHAKAFLHAGKR